MSTQIDTALVQQYSANLERAFQQKGSRLRDWVRVERQQGEHAYYDRTGKVSVNEIVTRHADTVLTDTPHTRRRVSLRHWSHADMIDDPDKVQTIANFQSPYLTEARDGMGRQLDQQIVDAAGGTSYSGKTGSTSVVFDTNQDVAVNYVDSGGAANSGLNVAKLRQARYLLQKQEAIEGNEVFVVTAKQLQDLLKETEVTSSDYAAVKALVHGEVNTFLGFTFISTELLPLVTATDVRTCYAWTRRAMIAAIGMEIQTFVGPNPSKNNNIQLQVKASFDASRMWEEGIVRVYADESP